MDPAESLLSKGAVPISFYGANAPSVRKAPRAFRAWPCRPEEKTHLPLPVEENPKGFSGVTLPDGRDSYSSIRSKTEIDKTITIYN